MDHIDFSMGYGLYGIIFWSVIVFVIFVLIRATTKQ